MTPRDATAEAAAELAPVPSSPAARAPNGAGAAGSRTLKRAAQVARDIEQHILERGWPVGESLGSEADMRAQYGVSRGVFREAIRLLEHDDVVRMRQGPGGGLIVTAPDASALTRVASLLLEYQRVDGAQMVEARIALETAAVALAIARLDDDGVRRLREVIDRESQLEPNLENPDDARGPAHTFQDLHRLIAELTGNPALILFVDVLSSLTGAKTMGAESLFDAEAESFMHGVEESHGEHRRIVDAMVARNVDLARARMVEHLHSTERFFAPREEPRA